MRTTIRWALLMGLVGVHYLASMVLIMLWAGAMMQGFDRGLPPTPSARVFDVLITIWLSPIFYPLLNSSKAVQVSSSVGHVLLVLNSAVWVLAIAMTYRILQGRFRGAA